VIGKRSSTFVKYLYVSGIDLDICSRAQTNLFLCGRLDI